MISILTSIVGYVEQFFSFLYPSRSLLFSWMNYLPSFLVPFCTAFILFLCLGLIIRLIESVFF